MFYLTFVIPVAHATCPDVATLEEPARGGWLVGSQRACLWRARRKRKEWELASYLLMADAEARSDRWTWMTLAEEHLHQKPSDGDLWVALVDEAVRHRSAAEVEYLTNLAVTHRESWAIEGDPRLASILRTRTYAALHARPGIGLEERHVRYAKEWMVEAGTAADGVASSDGSAL